MNVEINLILLAVLFVVVPLAALLIGYAVGLHRGLREGSELVEGFFENLRNEIKQEYGRPIHINKEPKKYASPYDVAKRALDFTHGRQDDPHWMNK